MNILDIHKRVLIENEALKLQGEVIKLQDILEDTHNKKGSDEIKREILKLTIQANAKFKDAARIG